MDNQDDGEAVQKFALKERIGHVIKNPIYLGLLFVFLLSLGSSVYVLFLSTPPVSTTSVAPPQTALQTVPNTPTVILSPTPTTILLTSLTPKPTQDPTTNWNIFTNVAYGYRIQYPPDWSVVNLGLLDSQTPNFVVFNPTSATSSARNITIAYSSRAQADLTAIYGPASGGQPITIFNMSGTQYNRKNSDGDKSVSILLPLTANTLIFYSIDQYQATLLQMLGTFKLIN